MTANNRICWARLPNSGLGNKLFVWARAFTFSRLNKLPLVVTGWVKFQKAPIMAGGDLRLYWNYFRSVREVSAFKRFWLRRSASVVCEPSIGAIATPTDPTIYEFSCIPHWSNMFGDLKPHREEVRDALLAMLTPARRRELAGAPKPQICVQVRMGDFRQLKPGEDFAKVGGVRTPLVYFTSLIQGIRKLHGTELPVLVVTDGKPGDLQELLCLPHVTMAPGNTKIVDILMMAKSKILIPSVGSTFGYWAGFLGDCAVIMHPDHIHEQIRPSSVNERFYEGPATGPPDRWPNLLKANIAGIREMQPTPFA
jgi:hypothetical protein